jgi:hypothetical protein
MGRCSRFNKSSEFVLNDSANPAPKDACAADDLEQAARGEFFHQQAVFRKQAGVVDADAVAEDFREFAAVFRVRLRI